MSQVAEAGEAALAFGIELSEATTAGEEAPEVVVVDRHIMTDPADAIAVWTDWLLATVQREGGRDTAVVSPGDA